MKLLLLENLKQSITHIVKTFNINISVAPTGRPRKIPKLDALILALYQHASTRTTKRSVYEDLKNTLRCSYKTLVVSMNNTGVLAKQILNLLMRFFAPRSHLIKYTDATDLPVCLRKNADSHRTMQGLAGWGHSSKGWYYGLKMTMTRDFDGRILGIRFSHPSMNDRDIFRSINKNLMGILVADAGYVSKKLEQDMSIEDKRILLIRPYKTMKRLAALWQLAVYKGRFKIEFDFRVLKLFHGLVTSMPRSVNGYLANYLHSLLSFVIA
jgi:Transposase DDE domain